MSAIHKLNWPLTAYLCEMCTSKYAKVILKTNMFWASSIFSLGEGMDESYETFEEELGPTRADPPPQKPVRQIHRPGGNTHTIWNACILKPSSIVHILYNYKYLGAAARGSTETWLLVKNNTVIMHLSCVGWLVRSSHQSVWSVF